jgi:hypothetical protein
MRLLCDRARDIGDLRRAGRLSNDIRMKIAADAAPDLPPRPRQRAISVAFSHAKVGLNP